VCVFAAKTRTGTMKLFTFSGMFLTDAAFTVRERRMTQRIRRTLDAWDRRGLMALVLDFRQHRGGNFWPQMRGFSRFLVGTPLFAWTSDGTVPRKWPTLKNETDPYFVDLSHPCHLGGPAQLARPGFPIALLLGPHTSSSGEIAAAMFAGKAGVRSFGQPTSGEMSVNGNWLLADGYTLVLTQQLVMLSDGRTGERLEPDVVCSNPLRHARSWLLAAAAV
jgi:C-terminal processing protease CtpA/Prc